MAADTERKTIGSVETAFSILEALDGLEPAGVSEIADHLAMSSSTAFVHLNTLVQTGYVSKQDTTYRRSLRFLEAGGVVRQHIEIGQLLREKVHELSEATGEIAGGAVEERGMRVILHRSSGRIAAGDEIPVGEHTHLHWTSLGKAILAYLPEERRDEIIDRGLPRGTDNTFTTPNGIKEELEHIKRQGYAIDDEEHLRGVRGIAVPILNAEQTAIASIGLTGPRNRFKSSYLAELLEKLKYAQNEIEVRSRYYTR